MAEDSTANQKIACTLGRGRVDIFDRSEASGYSRRKKPFQESGPRILDMSSAGTRAGETAATATDELSDPNFTPLPEHAGIKYFPKENARFRHTEHV